MANLPIVDPAVCAVIVTYNPSCLLLANVAALRSQVNHVVIVDNGSGSTSFQYTEAARQAFDCGVIRNGRNLGIAAALNIGVRHAASTNCGLVALFDQDSTVNDGFVAAMLRARSERENAGQIAIMAPQYVDRASSLPMLPAKDHGGNILATITSGSIIPLEIFRQCGFFDESLFIDYVDHEFCLRVRRMGFSIAQSDEARLLHSLGVMTAHRLLGKQFLTTNHSPARHYYMTRNRVWLYKRYAVLDFPWTSKDARALIAETAKILLVEEDKLSKVRNIVRGIRDALRGRMGERIPL